MALKSDKISLLIKEEIKEFENILVKEDDVGHTVTIGDGIILVYGLEKGMLGELVVFETNDVGLIMNLEKDSVLVALLSNTNSIKEGDLVKRTKKVLEVKVGDEILGRCCDALMNPIDGLGEINTSESSPIEKIAPGIMERESVNSPVETGILTIDSMIPIGKGQRELIIGDRQIGKTTLAIDTIINQRGKNIYCIYVAIGQKNSSVAKIYDKLKENNAMDYTVIISTSASENVCLQYITPFSGITLAEYWCNKGKDVLIVFDDLSKHAVSYRALSLLLKRSPGREAYPGDIFYLHSRLLERCVKLNKKNGGGSITGLPIVETQAGDISSYIPTNIISITDGQIFLKSDLFNRGQRPAIDIGLSVSRVGSSAQYKAIKKVSSSLKMEIASFNELQSFTQFGSDIDENTSKIINHGESIMEVLKQDQNSPLSFLEEVVYLFTIKNHYLDNTDKKEIKYLLRELYKYLNTNYNDLLTKINDTKDITNEDLEILKIGIEEYLESYNE